MTKKRTTRFAEYANLGAMVTALIRQFNRRDSHFQSTVTGNRVVLMHDGDMALSAMAEAIVKAQDEILLEMYWFASDTIGRRIANLLADKARSGVVVRVLYDAVGSWETDAAMFDQLREAGCEVRDYHPVAPWRRRFRLNRINYRDHRKILVVDGRIGITGGVNICDLWTCSEDGSGGWRDDAIQIEGAAVSQLRGVFFDTWNSLASETAPASTAVATAPVDSSGESVAGDSAGASCRVTVLANRYRGQKAVIRKAYITQIRNAQKSIFISNPYFVPDRASCRALANAVRRGVDVRVLVPEMCDVMPVYFASRWMFGWLLRRGIKIYVWPRSVLHAKTAVIDSYWSTIGTHNFDHRSWRNNLEVNVAVEDATVGKAMEAQFLRDLEHSQSVDLTTWRYRPLYLRVLERFFYAFRWLL